LLRLVCTGEHLSIACRVLKAALNRSLSYNEQTDAMQLARLLLAITAAENPYGGVTATFGTGSSGEMRAFSFVS